VCGQETRYGKRGGVLGYHHREDVDHAPIFGQRFTEEMAARVEAQRDEPRFRLPSAAMKHCVTYQALTPLEEYTTRRNDILKDTDATRRKRRIAELDGVDVDYIAPPPEPEIACHPIEVSDLKPRSGILQMANLILGKNKDKVQGWELRRLTHSRGPYVGSSGEVLSISDSIVMGARGPEVDSGVRVAVASWRDGEFDFGYTGILKDGVVTTQPANSNALKAWIKDIP